MYSRAKNSLDFVVILQVLFDNPIAFASGFLQAGPVQDFDLATTIVDVSSTLKFLCGHARGRAPHPKHVTQELMSQAKLVRIDPVRA